MIGTCRLCRADDVVLQDSHFLPAGLYRLVSAASAEHPVLMQKGGSVITADQARAHMLCVACERRFDKGGEEWLIENCWRDDHTFPLRTALLAGVPFHHERGLRAFDARIVLRADFDKLVYFAASIFWRASLSGWRFAKGRPSPLLFGPYDHQLRRFLLGEVPFPTNILLLVTVSELQDDVHNRVMSLPYRAGRAEGGYRYMFVVPGLTFIVMVGGQISERAKNIGTMPAGFVYVSEENDEQKLKSILRVSRNAPRRGKLATL